jgi:hypothetical protein
MGNQGGKALKWLSLCYDGENAETYFSYNPQYANAVEHLKEANMDDEMYIPLLTIMGNPPFQNVRLSQRWMQV